MQLMQRGWSNKKPYPANAADVGARGLLISSIPSPARRVPFAGPCVLSDKREAAQEVGCLSLCLGCWTSLQLSLTSAADVIQLLALWLLLHWHGHIDGLASPTCYLAQIFMPSAVHIVCSNQALHHWPSGTSGGDCIASKPWHAGG